MAKANYTCAGCGGSYSVVGRNRSDADRLAKYYEQSGRLCPNCYEKQRLAEQAAESQAALAVAAEMGLPTLQGTEKQVQWAVTLRKAVLDRVDMALKAVEAIGLEASQLRSEQAEDEAMTRAEAALADIDQQRREQAKEEFLLRHDPESWSPIELFRLFGALQTIICGFRGIPSPQGDGATVLGELPSRRLLLLLDTVAQVPDGEPIVIWAKYRYCVDQITAALAERYGPETVVPFSGKLNERQRADALARWNAGARFFVATQSAGGHGLNDLVRSCYIIFYADGYKYAERIQAEDRNHRIGQTRVPVYATIACEQSIDERIAQALDRKEGSLAAFQSMVSKYRKDGMKQKAIELVRSL